MALLHVQPDLYLTGTRTAYTDASQAVASPAIDCWRLPTVSAIATVSGATGSSGTWSLEGSSELPPVGQMPGFIPLNPGGVFDTPSWQPSESSWAELASAASVGNVATALAPAAPFLAARFVRVRWSPDAGTGGTLAVQVVGRSVA